MKKIYLVWVIFAYILAGCNGNTAAYGEHEHEAHEHEEGHDHDHEGHDHEHEEHDHEHEEAGEGHAGEISFKKALAEAVGLQTSKVEPAILSLASSSLSDGNVAAKAKYAYENAKKEYERMETLVGDKIVSAKDFEQARLNYENAKVAWEAVAGKQTANGVLVVSPINGYLKNLQVKEGDYVTVGQPLATISQNGRLVLRAEVSEKYYNYLPSIQSANFRTPYDNVTYKLSDLCGRLLSYGKASDTNSFYVPVTFEFDNKGAIIPGSFVEIYLLTAPMQNVISVPVSALIEEQGVYSVFVRVHEEAYKKVPVTLGADNGSEVQILSGLNAGDEVVTVGAYQIKLASASNAIPAHTHNH